MSVTDHIQSFLASDPYAVVGASVDRSKYGNKVLRCYQQHGREVYPINARAEEILVRFGLGTRLRHRPQQLSTGEQQRLAPPAITEQVVRDAAAAGVTHIWMQPGAESDEAIRLAEAAGMAVIAGGPCLLVVLGYHE